jgi:monoamine oxidase
MNQPTLVMFVVLLMTFARIFGARAAVAAGGGSGAGDSCSEGSCSAPSARRLRVAVVGAGISGGCGAYFLAETLPGAEVVVFEREADVGGRVQSLVLADGRKVEAGASIYHVKNRLIRDLVEKFGLQERPLAAAQNDSDHHRYASGGTRLARLLLMAQPKRAAVDLGSGMARSLCSKRAASVRF